jgi:hypothetical protein
MNCLDHIVLRFNVTSSEKSSFLDHPNFHLYLQPNQYHKLSDLFSYLLSVFLLESRFYQSKAQPLFITVFPIHSNLRSGLKEAKEELGGKKSPESSKNRSRSHRLSFLSGILLGHLLSQLTFLSTQLQARQGVLKAKECWAGISCHCSF